MYDQHLIEETVVGPFRGVYPRGDALTNNVLLEDGFDLLLETGGNDMLLLED